MREKPRAVSSGSEQDFVYYLSDPGLEAFCEPALAELAERLAEHLELEVEMVFPEAGNETIVLCDPEGGGEYLYKVQRRPT